MAAYSARLPWSVVGDAVMLGHTVRKMEDAAKKGGQKPRLQLKGISKSHMTADERHRTFTSTVRASRVATRSVAVIASILIIARA